MASASAPSPFQALARRHRTPRDVQRFLRTLPYNREKGGETVRSALSAWQHRETHCLEAAFLAAAILEHHGFPPLVMSLESQDDLDHVVFVFQDPRTRLWGSIGRSRDEGLHGRAPRHRSLRALARSYFDPFVDKTGRIEAFGLACLDESGTRWRDSSRNLWKAEQFLIDLPHQKLPISDRYYLKILNSYIKNGPPSIRPGWW